VDGTGRSICDNYIFRKNCTQEYPQYLGENPLEDPGKECHFTVGHPGSLSDK